MDDEGIYMCVGVQIVECVSKGCDVTELQLLGTDSFCWMDKVCGWQARMRLRHLEQLLRMSRCQMNALKKWHPALFPRRRRCRRLLTNLLWRKRGRL